MSKYVKLKIKKLNQNFKKSEKKHRKIKIPKTFKTKQFGFFC